MAGLVGSEHFGADVAQAAQRFAAGMPVAVVFSDADHGIARHDLAQKDVRGGCVAAVMPDFQKRGGKIGAAVDEVSFGGGFHVAGEKKARLSEVDSKDDGHVVRFAVVLYGTQDRDLRAAERELIARLRYFDGKSLFLRIFFKILESF